MAIIIRIEIQGDRRGVKPSGWLVLEYGQPNLFHRDDGLMSVAEVQKKYGGIVKETIRVGSTEYQRLLAKSGVRE
jgi:hypothetical protein